MKIGLLSDTHSFLDPRIYDYFKDCDEIWHAGDIGSIELLDELEKFKPLKAVYGNIDGKEIRTEAPEEQIFECAGMKIWMIHIGGYPPKYTRMIKEKLTEYKPDIFICGHSHILKIIFDKERKVLHINPGAAGNHGFHQIKTMVRFEINQGKVENLEVIELGKRGR
ncbi:metallophosphoesterase family protein [Flexithrix dorotheae]|uniref:metallophosphoesterase family protein n=1 Tax=Flexithrix dorotheae TaxID=70993 RepID=UPI0003657439|nr:metallophosphoesterase family protein [Flexithrix dorotheae]